MANILVLASKSHIGQSLVVYLLYHAQYPWLFLSVCYDLFILVLSLFAFTALTSEF